jgi:YidC/Oxa1 family membrane protein insertase
VNDRRPLIAIALILLISVAPMFWKKAPVVGVDSLGTAAPTTAVAAPGSTAAAALPTVDSAVESQSAPAAPASEPLDADVPAQVVLVRSGLYEYGISTRGGRLVSARILPYTSTHPADTLAGGGRDTVQLIRPEAPLLANRLLIAGDTVRLDEVVFSADASELTVADAAGVLTLTGQAGPYAVELQYTFAPDDYRIHLDGTVRNLNGAGGTLLVGLGNGFRDTESDTLVNHRESGVVTKLDGTKLTRYGSLDPGATVLPGPFEWVAVKSKYFVAGLFAYDSTATAGARGLIGGVQATVAPDAGKSPIRAAVVASMVLPPSGAFQTTLFLGPMEVDRLSAIGHDFDDVNPYGWPGFRTVIRPFAVGIRAVFVWMHDVTGLSFGWVIVLFGVMVRVLLWPLNQKAMRSMTAMQAIQPQLTALQAKYKEDPQRLQQEMFKLYKDNNVNPFGGCWPMLLPYPLLVAVFFVLANTIELRGVPFLWMTDLSRQDPLFIIPVVMAVSMFAVSKIGMMGMPPNPQSKMMMYLMPVMMLVLFFRFAAGLNLYYAVQNIVSLPQQWLIMKERRKLMPKAAPAVEVRTKKKS